MEQKAYRGAIRRFEKAISLNPDHLEAQYYLGVVLIRAGKYQKSIKPLERTIQLDPDHIRAYLYKGFALFHMKEYQEAAKWMDATLNVLNGLTHRQGKTDDHMLARSHFYKGLALFGMGEYGRAVQCYDVSIGIEPDKWDVHSNKGDALRALGRIQEAKECFDRCRKLKPGNPEPHAKARASPNPKARAGANARLAVPPDDIVTSRSAPGDKPAAGDTDVEEACQTSDVIKGLERQMEANPGNTEILYRLADALRDAGQYHMAAKHYETLTGLNPTDAEARRWRGMMLYKLGKYHQAIQCYRRVIEMEPDNYLAYVDEIHALLRIKEYDAALERADLLLQKIPGELPYTIKGDVLFHMGEYRRALEIYDEALLCDPDRNTTYFQKADILYQIDQHRQAIQCIDTYMQLHPEDPDAHYEKCVMLTKMGRYEDALGCIDEAIRLDPDKPRYHVGKGMTLAHAKRRHEALASYEKALALDADDTGALWEKSCIMFDLKEYAGAEECCDKLIRLKPCNALMHCHKCIALMWQWKLDLAQASIDRAIQLDPDNADIRDAQEALRDRKMLAAMGCTSSTVRQNM